VQWRGEELSNVARAEGEKMILEKAVEYAPKDMNG
jgi:hypothetical protein